MLQLDVNQIQAGVKEDFKLLICKSYQREPIAITLQ
jgi:hypothetical protein